jgi:hypothetical protein
MDYHMENKILLSEDSEYKNLYSWSLQEFNNEGKKIGRDQISWQCGLYFTASELRHYYSINISKSKNNEDKKPTQESEVITAILHPGTCYDGKTLKDDVSYSMFGTNRTIKKFTLRIQKIEDDSDNEFCRIRGYVSYTAEVDFRDITTDDTIDITLRLLPQRFNKIAELIKTQRIDILGLYLDEVSGFYSEWSPSISTGSIKVLAAQEEQVVVKKDDCKINPPRLGEVSEFDLGITRRHKLNLKQDLGSINIDKLFYDFDGTSEESTTEEEFQESQSDKASSMLSQLAHNETALNQLRIPIWFIFVILCIFLIKGWF